MKQKIIKIFKILCVGIGLFILGLSISFGIVLLTDCFPRAMVLIAFVIYFYNACLMINE